jgi:hypothetical protein
VFYETYFYRDDLAPVATTPLTRCANRGCFTASYDRSQVISVYNG